MMLPAARSQGDGSVEAIRQEVERLRGELARFDLQESGIVGGLERLSLERLILEEEIRGLGAEKARTEAGAEAARLRLGILEERLHQGRAYLAASLREAYKLGSLRHFRMLLEVEDPDAFARAWRYIAKWSRNDAERVEAFRRDVESLELERLRLQERLAELERIGRDGNARREDLERNRVEQMQALRRLERERTAGEEAVKELEEAAGRLQALVTALPPGQRPPVDGRLIDLEGLKGHLPWPASGRVSVPFGDIRHPRFRTLTPHPGVDLAVPEGTPVKSIFGGQVVYADWFRGYGITVIVDHGEGTYSVYAHLRSIAVQLGDHVDPAVTLGASGSTGSLRGPGLYLEIRHDGAPEDPMQWLRPQP